METSATSRTVDAGGALVLMQEQDAYRKPIEYISVIPKSILST